MKPMDFSSFSPRRKVTIVALLAGIVLVVILLLAGIFGKGPKNEIPPAPPLPPVPTNPPSEYPKEYMLNDGSALPPPPAIPME
jgi:hypothetical protein